MGFVAPPDNMTGFVEFLQYTNYLTGNLIGLGILLVIYIVSFIATKAYPSDRSIIFSAFFGTIVAILLRFLDLIGDVLLTVSILILAGALWYLYNERGSEQV